MRHLKLVDSDKINLLTGLYNFIKHDSSKRHKINVIETIFNNAPIQHQFIMVGDSGELDPEVKNNQLKSFNIPIYYFWLDLW